MSDIQARIEELLLEEHPIRGTTDCTTCTRFELLRELLEVVAPGRLAELRAEHNS